MPNRQLKKNSYKNNKYTLLNTKILNIKTIDIKDVVQDNKYKDHVKFVYKWNSTLHESWWCRNTNVGIRKLNCESN